MRSVRSSRLRLYPSSPDRTPSDTPAGDPAHRVRRLLRTILALAVVACAEPSGITEGPSGPSGGGGGGGGAGLDVAPAGDSIQSETVGPGASLQLEVMVSAEGGAPAAGVPVLWSVTDGTASVSPDSSATDSAGAASATVSVGTEAGLNLVVARVPGDSVTFHVTAEADVPASVVVSPSSVTLEVGGASQLTSLVSDQHGNPVDAAVVWSSSEGGVASVDGTGLIEGQNVGSTTVTATVDSLHDEAQVEVVDANPVQSVSVSPSSATISGIGATRQFEATARDSVGNTVPTAAINWRSTDEGVVTVNANGLTTARAVGTALIVATAACCGGPADSGMVIVDDPPPPVQGFPNLPGGWTVVNDNPWDAIPIWNSSCGAPGGVDGRPNGWGKVISSGPGGCPAGEGAVVQLQDAPDGDPNVFRMTWNPGHPGGEDGYGVFYSPGEEGHTSRDIYFATWFRFGEAGDPTSFKRHGNGLKMISFDGHQAGQRTNMNWSDLNFGAGSCPDAFAMSAPDGPFGDAIHWTSSLPGYEAVKFRASCMAGQEHHQQGFFAHPDQGYDPSIRMPIGEWVLLEIQWEASPARIRWWWNGQLVADFTGGTIPYPIYDILMDGTWGGGPSSVPAPQHWYIARTLVAIP